MNRPQKPSITSLFLWIAMFSASAAAQRVDYEIAFPNAAHHEAEVHVTFQDIPMGEALEVRMSRTSPGRYALHEFAKNVYKVAVSDGQDNPLNFTRPNPHQWDVADHDGTVRLSYTLFGDRADGTYTAIDETHAHLNMPATFMWARGLEDAPIRIRFEALRPDWEIATQLFPTSDNAVFTAPDLPYFLDSPSELSAHVVREWALASNGETYTIRLAVHHAGTDGEVDDYAELAKRVVSEQVAVYGELPRYETDRYTFIADYLPYVSRDGMEHRNSTILTSRNPLSTGARANLGTLSHEFFHSWNVERIRPQTLEPFDLEEANMSGELWFAEGFTSYYGPLFIRRAGIGSDGDYADNISRVLDTVINAPGRRFFSPVEMSMQAPFVDAAVSIDPQNSDNTFISYYDWGSAIGLGLDLTLRTRFSTTLDDYMRAVWFAHGQTERPYTQANLERVLGETTGDQAFAADFFRRYVEGREVMDYTALLANGGYVLRRTNSGNPWLGANILGQRGNTIVGGTPILGSPLYEAGLEAGAILMEVDGSPISSAAYFENVIRSRRVGDQLALDYEFRGEQKQTTLALTEDPALEVVTYERANIRVTDAIRNFRESWLGSKAIQTQ
jgi:predicted metalloprotease with PDZ domain